MVIFTDVNCLKHLKLMYGKNMQIITKISKSCSCQRGKLKESVNLMKMPKNRNKNQTKNHVGVGNITLNKNMMKNYICLFNCYHI